YFGRSVGLEGKDSKGRNEPERGVVLTVTYILSKRKGKRGGPEARQKAGDAVAIISEFVSEQPLQMLLFLTNNPRIDNPGRKQKQSGNDRIPTHYRETQRQE